ncbi:MAG: hypothetical protein KF901_15610 [Myxococcales bacterium]|nr:hypothetical protein [Myxococcales bacterium]
MARSGWESSEWSALSSVVDELGSADDPRPPADVIAASLLEGARLVVVGDDPVVTDGLVQQLRAHGAFVGVTDGRGRGLSRLGFLDAQAVLLDPSRAAEDRVARALEAEVRLRGAAVIPFSWDEVWPGGEPQLMPLATTIAREIQLDRELRWMAQARSSFPVPFARLGPTRTLQALAGACGAVLRLVVADDDIRATVEIGGDLIVSATWYQGQSAAPRYVGTRALGAFLGLRSGRAHVERHELARVMTIMAPVSLALLGADRERHATTSDLRALAPREGETVDRVALSAMLASQEDEADAPPARPAVAPPSAEDASWEDVTTKQGLTPLPPEAFPEDPPTEDLLPTGRRGLEGALSGALGLAPTAPSSASLPSIGVPVSFDDEPAAPKERGREAEATAGDVSANEASTGNAAVGDASASEAAVGEASTGRASAGEASAGRASAGEAVIGGAAVGDAGSEPDASAERAATVVESAATARALSPVDELLEGSSRGAPSVAMKATVEAPWAKAAQVSLPLPPRPLEPKRAKPAWMKELGDAPTSPLAPRVLVAAAGYRPPVAVKVDEPPRVAPPATRAPAPRGWMPLALAAVATAALGWLLATALDVDGADEGATVASLAPRVSSAPEELRAEQGEASVRVGQDAPSRALTASARAEARAPGATALEATAPEARAPQTADDVTSPRAANAREPAEAATPGTFLARAPDRFFPSDLSGAGDDRELSDRLFRSAREVWGAERRQLLWEAAHAHRRNPHVAAELAHLAFEDGDLELAEAWAREAVSIRRRRDEYRVLLGRILRERGTSSPRAE